MGRRAGWMAPGRPGGGRRTDIGPGTGGHRPGGAGTEPTRPWYDRPRSGPARRSYTAGMRVMEQPRADRRSAGGRRRPASPARNEPSARSAVVPCGVGRPNQAECQARPSLPPFSMAEPRQSSGEGFQGPPGASSPPHDRPPVRFPTLFLAGRLDAGGAGVYRRLSDASGFADLRQGRGMSRRPRRDGRPGAGAPPFPPLCQNRHPLGCSWIPVL